MIRVGTMMMVVMIAMVTMIRRKDNEESVKLAVVQDQPLMTSCTDPSQL